MVLGRTSRGFETNAETFVARKGDRSFVMRKKSRWMNWVLEEADRFDTAMPWERRVRTGGWKKRLAKRYPILRAIGA